MSKTLIKPYELSIWDNELTNTEQKIAVIGTHLLKTPNMAYNIVFKKNKNGEKTLSFDIKYKYYNLDTGQMEENPFVPYLINERKVKLFYDNEWYDFIIKEVQESSEEYTWSYTAYDAFVLELSKNGYDITFSTELNNNLGTAYDLASKTLENTDWLVIDVDVPPPKIAESVFMGQTEKDIVVKNMDTNEDEVIQAHTNILIFYSYIVNENGKYLQFILSQDNYNLDESTNTIIATNYRFDKELSFESVEEDDETKTYINDETGHIISYTEVYQQYDAFRIIYQQVSFYDSVMGKIVDQYTDGSTKINHYNDYTYTTSNVVTSFITNGDNFDTYENGSLYGWIRYGGAEPNWPDIKLTTYPEIKPENPLLDLDAIKQIEGYLQVKFKSNENSYLYNDGIQNNQSIIGAIAKGDRFVFRWRGGKASSDHGELTKMSGDELRAKVCFYKEETVVDGNTSRYAKIPISDIISFDGTAHTFNGLIQGGVLVNNNKQYIIDGVEEIPSSQYLYKSEGIEYYWDNEAGEDGKGAYIEYNEETNQKFLDYYYLTGTALMTVTPEQLQDPMVKLGIFIYCTGDYNNEWYYLQDIQLTRLYIDDEDNILTIGNVPKATAYFTDYYYLAPKEKDDKNKIPLFTSLEDLANEYNLIYENIEPVYNQGEVIFTDTDTRLFWVKRQQAQRLYEQFEVRGYALVKISTIEAAHSNCFNILQTIAETFECWIDIYVEHNEDGSIYYDDNGLPLKAVLLREFSGNDNFAGFKYGININQITRTIDSNEIVTKLIVDDSNSELVEDGVISIAQADSNPNKESYIYRFDYFLNQGLLPRESFTQDLTDYNLILQKINTNLHDLQEENIQLSNSLIQVSSNRNVYGTLLATAHDKMNQALDEFEALTGYSYADYQANPADNNNLITGVDKVVEIIGTIYNCAAIENSYRGLYTNTEVEYTELNQRLKGIKEHAITVSCVQGENARYLRVKVDDYIIPFKFTVNGVEYETSLSNKDFEIEAGEGDIVITNIIYSISEETGYQLLDANNNLVEQIIANDYTVQTFRLVPNSPVEGIESQIDELIDIKKQILKQFNIKYSRFILEGNWNSQDYLSDELYYLDATIAERVSAFPKVTYNINVVDVSGLDEYQAYNFTAGEKTYIEDTEFFGWVEIDGAKTPVREEVIISDIEWHLDDPSQNVITIQNYKTHFEDLFQRIQATVQTVQYNEITYPNTHSIIDEERRINQGLLVASLDRVAGAKRALTADGSILINGNTIEILDLSNKLNVLKLSSEGLSISSDGGSSWITAVTGEGINIEHLTSTFINTKEIWIGSKDSPSFRWDNNGISAFKLNPLNISPKYDFKQFVRFDRFGLYGIQLDQQSEYVVNELQDIKDNASFAVTWDGFFIRNNYTDGRVEITSDNDFRVIQTLEGSDHERIKIGALEFDQFGNPIKYGININQTVYDYDSEQYIDIPAFTTGSDGNITITGTINAIAGNFSGIVNVGPENQNHIIIDGRSGTNTPSIASSNYQDGAGVGWMINKTGDAVFNNITARGSIKTAVFEYAEIQAVGGIFLFRPSSRIKQARIAPNETDLILQVEKPALFAKTQDQEYSWCKISNYTTNGTEPDAQGALASNGLTHVYKILSVDVNTGEITLINGVSFINAIIKQDQTVDDILEELKGGALVDMGREDQSSNYGIGVNSSDNINNLPRRAISLFETAIHSNNTPKITYEYTAILGTLPPLSTEQVNRNIYTNMVDSQGIYTNNMYIGDVNQYVAFYTGNETPTPQKHLAIKAKEFMLEAGEAGQNNYIYLSNNGNTYPTDDPNTAWRLMIGQNFRVTENGNLYAANASIDGDIIAKSLTISNGDDSFSAWDAINISGYTIEIEVIEITGSDTQVKLQPHLYHNGIEVEEPELIPSSFLWYENGEFFPSFNSQDGSIIATRPNSYRVTYQFDDGDTEGATPIQTIVVDDESTRYITEINQTGIKIHPEVWTNQSSYIQLDGTGVELFDSNNNSIAFYGNTARIGKENQTRIEINSNSLKMIHQRERTPYLFISDLRDENNEYTVNDSFIGTGSTVRFFLSAQASNNTYNVKLNDVEVTTGITKNEYDIIFSTAPAEGDMVQVIYKTTQALAKAYTLGIRSGSIGLMSYAIGYYCEASGNFSYAEGSSVKAKGNESHAEGLETIASGYCSHAEGAVTIASNSYSHAEGFHTQANGIIAHAEGYQTIVNGLYSHAEGYQTIVNGRCSHAEGDTTQANSDTSHAEGNHTIASGWVSHAEGDRTQASGVGSHAEGAGGLADSTIGIIASGSGSHAEGMTKYSNSIAKIIASGTGSHAEGDTYGQYDIIASGMGSHAEGCGTNAIGIASHAEGYRTIASGSYSHAGGYQTVATNNSQTVVGKYNVATRNGSGTTEDPYIYNNAGNYAFIIGNGTDDDTVTRSNALTVDWFGNTTIAGTLTQSSDRRLKDHQSYLSTDAIEFIQKLKPAYFKKDEKSHVGFYAQDVEQADPWHCMTGEMNGFKTLGYTEIIAPLVAYCQHLEERIKQLEDK